MDRNSSKNQSIKRHFVEREVMANVGSMVEYILQQEDHKNAPFTWDDAENLFVPKCPECGDYNSIAESENEDGETVYTCSYCEKEFDEEPETEQQEIFEWYLVTNWLGEKLAAKGEVIINDGYHYIWGRGTTGQAILLDGVISEICEEMEILEGQKNEWNV